MKKLMNCVALLIAICTGTVAYSAPASSNSLKLNVNGLTVTDHQPVLLNNTTMIPIRDVSLLPDFTVHWNHTTKTVEVTNTSEHQTVQITMGQNIASINGKVVNLNTPALVINGTAYVPLRFIGESLNSEVSWNAKTSTVVIYTVDKAIIKTYQSTDLVNSRNAALQLTRINLNQGLFTSDEGHTTVYFFPVGKSNSFFIADRGVVKYYEVRDGAAWKVWEATQGDAKGRAIIPGIIEGVDQEWGERPTHHGMFSYFADYWMENRLEYGMINEVGKTKEIGSVSMDPNRGIVQEIPADRVKK